MKRSDSIVDLAKALSKAQSQIKNATKDAENPHFKSFYADLASVWAAVSDPLTKNGLSIIQTTDLIPEGPAIQVVLGTTLLHDSGQFITGFYPILPERSGPQAMKSAVTYAKRVTIEAICGVASEEDDGEAAEGRYTEDTPRTPIRNNPNKMAEPPKLQTPVTLPAVKPTIENKAPNAVTEPQSSWVKAVAEQGKKINENASDPHANYLITFGSKFKNKTIGELDIYDLQNYVTWLKGQDKIGKVQKEFLSHAEPFLQSRVAVATKKEAAEAAQPKVINEKEAEEALSMASNENFMNDSDIPF